MRGRSEVAQRVQTPRIPFSDKPKDTCQIVTKNAGHKPTAIDETSGTEDLVVLLLPLRFIGWGRIRPLSSLVNIEKLLDNVVVVPGVHDEESSCGKWHAKQPGVGERVWVDPACPIVQTDLLEIVLARTVNWGEVEVR